MNINSRACCSSLKGKLLSNWKRLFVPVICVLLLLYVLPFLMIEPSLPPKIPLAQNAKPISVTLLIIDSRFVDSINSAIHSMLKNTPTSWTLSIVHTPVSVDPEHLRWFKGLTSVEAAMAQGRKVIFKPNTPFCVNKDGNCVSYDKMFWEQFEEDFILFFQADSALCHRANRSMADYLMYDYIGAPWYPPQKFDGTRIEVGNGGISLRNKTFMVDCLDKGVNKLLPLAKPEDTFFSYCALKYGRPAPVDVARNFAVEQYFDFEALGIHQPCSNPNVVCRKEKFMSDWKCPESNFLFEECSVEKMCYCGDFGQLWAKHSWGSFSSANIRQCVWVLSTLYVFPVFLPVLVPLGLNNDF